MHDEEESLALRMDLLSALIRGFKDAERVCVPLRALRADSFVTRQKQEKENETEQEKTIADNRDAGRGCRFKVGAGPGEIEDVLLIYARALVVTSQVCVSEREIESARARERASKRDRQRESARERGRKRESERDRER